MALGQWRESHAEGRGSVWGVAPPSQIFRKVRTFLIGGLGNSKGPKGGFGPS